MAYGFRSRFSKSFRAGGRGRYSVGASRSFYRKKIAFPKRRKTGYIPKRDNERTYTKKRGLAVEKKYDDDYMDVGEWTRFVKAGVLNAAPSVSFAFGGRIARLINQYAGVLIGQGTNPTDLNEGMIEAVSMYPNCLTNIESGTTSMTRVGSMVDPEWIRLKGVIAASTILMTDGTDPETTFNNGAKAVPSAADADYEPTYRYMRTAIKLMIVRDKHMNEKGYVEYTDLFEPPIGNGTTWGSADNQPYLWNRKVDTLDRYEVLREITYNLDQDDPQCQFDEIISLKGYPIRFNGATTTQIKHSPHLGLLKLNNGTTLPAQAMAGVYSSDETQSMTNGIYLIGVSMSQSTNTAVPTNSNSFSPKLSVSVRTCFTDA